MGVTTFFKEMESKRPSMKKRLRNRKRLYEVSDLKFYRSLSRGELEKEGYQLVFNRKPIAIRDHVPSREIGSFFRVSFRELQYVLLDSANNQTDLHIGTSQNIVIDTYGNCLTGREITFGGFLGNLHLSGMLPLNYYPE